MAVLTVTPITKAGLNQITSLVAADAAGDAVPSSSGLLVMVNNADSGARVVTITAPVSSTNCGNYGSLPVADIVHNIPAGESLSFTIPAGYANSSGQLAWTYDAVAATTVGVFSLA